MKKFIMLALAAMAACSAFSQGTLQFQNGATTAIYTNTTPDGGTRGKAAPGFLYYALLWGNTAADAQSGANVSATVGNSATSYGVIAGSANFAIAGTNPGDTDYFQMIAWQASFGTGFAGYQAALAGGIAGSSAVLPFVLGPSSGPGTVIFSSTDPTKFQGFDIGPLPLYTPEPTTLAIGSLGAAALLLFRRKK
jgi:hypothetical protein